MMRARVTGAFVAIMFLASVTRAELNTAMYISVDGAGSGAVEGDMTGVGPVTILDIPGDNVNGLGGDMWNGGDRFQYLYDSTLNTGSFTATVRVVSQTEAIDGSWGKNGIRASSDLTGNSANAMVQIAAGNGAQQDPPPGGSVNPVPVRLAGRTGNDGQGGFEMPVRNSVTGADVPNNVFPYTDAIPAPANVSWLSLNYSASSNSFWAGFAADDNGAPGVWHFSDVTTSVPASGEGWYVGLAYSAHSDMAASQVTRADGLHGITYDNYSIGDLMKRPLEVGQDLTLKGVLDVVRGPDITARGLAQEWIDGNFRNNPDGLAAAIPVNAGDPFTTEPTWWSGSATQAGIAKYPNVPQLIGSKFAGNPTDVNQYAVRLTGQVFFPEDGNYLMRDSVDDYTMVRIDLDGDGQITGDLLPAPGQANGANDEVVIHDDAWNGIDGEGGNLATIDEEAFFQVTNVPAGGAWRDIEVWTGEDGGGDAGVLYMTRDASPDADNWPTAAFSAAQVAEYRMSNDILRTTVPGEILSGTATASLDEGIEYIMTVNSAILRSDLISVADPGGAAVTRLDLTGGTVRIVEDGELVPGDEFVLFGADELLGEDEVNLIFDDPTKWDLSGLSVDGLGGHRIRYIGDSVSFDCNGDGVVDVLDANCATVDTLDATLAAANLIKGDADGDGEVQFPDFVILANNFANPGEYTQGDFDKDGSVQFPDFVILANNFGLTSGGAAAAAVPEPSGVAVLAMAGLLLGWARRRRR